MSGTPRSGPNVLAPGAPLTGSLDANRGPPLEPPPSIARPPRRPPPAPPPPPHPPRAPSNGSADPAPLPHERCHDLGRLYHRREPHTLVRGVGLLRVGPETDGRGIAHRPSDPG